MSFGIDKFKKNVKTHKTISYKNVLYINLLNFIKILNDN